MNRGEDAFQAECPSRLQDADAEMLNAALRNANRSAEEIVLADADFLPLPAELRQAMVLLHDDRQTAGLLLLCPPKFPVPAVWGGDGLPAHLLVFLPLVNRIGAVVLRRESLSDDAPGKFRPVEEPLREWFVRAVLTGQNVICRTVEPPDHLPDDHSTPSAAGTDFLPALRPSRPKKERRWICTAIEQYRLSGGEMSEQSTADVTALRAGLLQMNDFLEESHQLSQSVQGEGRHAAGDYWHGIMHRREPDYSNAKYWFRRVGNHPVFAELSLWAEQRLQAFPGVKTQWRPRLLAGGEWNPLSFIDLCEACPAREEDDLSRFARQLQWIEMLLLLRQTARDALGRVVWGENGGIR